VTEQVGMFCYSGLTAAEVAALREGYSIYLTADGRISMAGLTERNVDYVASAIREVTAAAAAVAAAGAGEAQRQSRL